MFTSCKVQENLLPRILIQSFAKSILDNVCIFFVDLARTKLCKICSLLLSLISDKVISLLTTSFCSRCHISTSNIAQNIDNIDTLFRSSDFSIPKPKVLCLSSILVFSFYHHNINFQHNISTIFLNILV